VAVYLFFIFNFLLLQFLDACPPPADLPAVASLLNSGLGQLSADI